MKIGTPGTVTATKIMLLGAGELGKEVAIAALQLGLEVMAVDRYANAPAMQVTQHHAVIDMLDGEALESLVRSYQPHFIVPEVEAIATDRLVQLEQAGFCVVPSARATQLTMDREGIRRLVSEKLGFNTSRYLFADNETEFMQAVETLHLPCVVKPLMSSSGKGQSVIRTPHDIATAWQYSQQAGRTGAGRVIVETFIDFDYEITLLTIRTRQGTYFCEPIGHQQVAGDYQRSWQPQPMSQSALAMAQQIARAVTDELTGYGLFGVEFFVKGDQVYFNELSPRPHDTGLVTLISQNLSEFQLHLRAFLGLPIPAIHSYGPAASRAIVVTTGSPQIVAFDRVEKALAIDNTALRLFGKPVVDGKRRMGVALALGSTLAEAKAHAEQVLAALVVGTVDV